MRQKKRAHEGAEGEERFRWFGRWREALSFRSAERRFGPHAAVAAAILCIVVIAGCSAPSGSGGSLSQAEETPAVVEVSGEMSVDILDIGKADCSVIRSENQVTVIDTGYKDTSDIVLEYMESQGIEKIDHLIITHFDKDHIGGAADLLEACEVGTIYQPDYSADEEDSKPYNRYVEKLEEKNLNPVTVRAAMGIIMDDVVLTVYPPKKLEYSKDKDNNRSLVTVLEHGKVRMLFAGDAEEERIEEIYSQIEDLNFDLLKVPHHGHMEKNSEEFFRKISPDYAVICAEKGSGGDSPDEEAVEALEDTGAEVLVTGDGEVHCLSDGKKLTVSQE